MNQHNDQTVTLMELAATFETCIDFLPPAGRKNISRAVEQLRTYGELCRASAGREAVDCRKIGGDVPVTISRETARVALAAMDKAWPGRDFGEMYADDKSFMRASFAELEAAANAELRALAQKAEESSVLFRHSTDSNPMIGVITELLEDSGRYVVAVTSNGGGVRQEVDAGDIAKALNAIVAEVQTDG